MFLKYLCKFQTDTCNSVRTPAEVGMKLEKDPQGKKVDSTLYKQIVGNLMYLTTSRPDITYAISLISRYMEAPTEMHLNVAKRILRYLKGTPDLGIFFIRKVPNQFCLVLLIVIMLEIPTIDVVRRAMPLCLGLESYHGVQRSNKLCLYQPRKLNTLQLPLALVKLYG